MLNDFVIVKVSTQKHVLTTNTKKETRHRICCKYIEALGGQHTNCLQNIAVDFLVIVSKVFKHYSSTQCLIQGSNVMCSFM